MTEQCYYIGIDMDDRNAVISYYKAGMRVRSQEVRFTRSRWR